ncbi:hypothetical protein B9Z55_016176 [Caenorhabditis nigoni]|uniref:Tyrosine-protein phosphatase domain-containing protein n=1 Tax=Caenorhabditis nigoni TaxID=1611254 RepID=A0A2G5UED6_9PELO|nr:hypothetical protein B9Z55_016176 [Caenorhabditis nigoni]
MSGNASLSVWNEDGPPLDDQGSPEQKSKNPPPLPTSTPVVKSAVEDVPTGDLIQFESEEERVNTVDPTAPTAETPVPMEEQQSMESILRGFLKEEESLTGPDYQKRFYQIRIEQERLKSEYSADCANAPRHLPRNRYRDILPYDHNRVELAKDSENPEGYMNASLIQLPGGKTNFIAAQAPLELTLGEWWQMIDEHNVHLVVMLCKLIELNKVKCERYWPDTIGEVEMFGLLEVTLEEEKHFPDDEYLLRVFKMENPSTGETRTVRQLHYREWPDHGCPSGEKQLLKMIDHMEELHDQYSPESPILVHCSAGVGRTGTIIAINYIREQMKAQSLTEIDIFGLVIALRRQRASMVQTQDQYQFVHRCIASYCRKHLGIEEPKPDNLATQLPVAGSNACRKYSRRRDGRHQCAGFSERAACPTGAGGSGQQCGNALNPECSSIHSTTSSSTNFRSTIDSFVNRASSAIREQKGRLERGTSRFLESIKKSTTSFAASSDSSSTTSSYSSSS